MSNVHRSSGGALGERLRRGPWLAYRRADDRATWRLRAHVVWVLLLIESGLRRRTPLPVLCQKIGATLSSSKARSGMPADVPGEVLQPLRRAAQRADRAVRLWPFGDTCLRRALLIAALTSDIDSAVVIGVKKAEDGRFLAHAWVEVDGISLDPTAVDYTSFAA